MLTLIKDWLPLLIGLITFLGGTIAWYSGAIEKRYAAQRDFNHLKKNQENIARGVSELFKEQDKRFDQLEKENAELKNLLMNVFMTQTGESISAIMRKRDKEER